MIARTLDAGVLCGWALAGRGARGRPAAADGVGGARQTYLLGIRGNDKLWSELDGSVGQHAPEALARALPPQAWRRLSAGAGTKGERWYD